jgi:hypothetical protein
VHKNNLYILTRCSRLENLLNIKKSIFDNKNDFWNINWYIAVDNKKIKNIPSHILNNLQSENIKLFFDLNSDGIYGNNLLNELLNIIDQKENNWIYILDDDNKLHERFLNRTSEILKTNICKCIIFSQMSLDTRFGNSLFRTASEKNINVKKIDMAQFLINSVLIKNNRFEINEYVSDGIFITKIYYENPNDFYIIDEILCYYNFYSK